MYLFLGFFLFFSKSLIHCVLTVGKVNLGLNIKSNKLQIEAAGINYNTNILLLKREREAIAAELAREIEGSSQSSRTAVELENGDEEELFSAVVRPQRGLILNLPCRF